MNFYQALWFYANCKPAKQPSIVCALAKQEPDQTEQINLLWCSIHNSINQLTPREIQTINQIIEIAKSANSPHHLKQLLNPKPTKLLQQRFKQILKNDQMTKLLTNPNNT